MLKFLSPTLLAAALHGFMEPDKGDGAGGAGGTGDADKGGDTNKGGDANKGGEGGKGGDEKLDPLTTDIKAAIEKARSQEKAKLYGEIEERKKAAKIAEELAAARDAEVKTLKQQMAELQAKLKPENEGDDDKKKSKKVLDEELLNKAIDAAVNATSKKFEEQLALAQKRVEELERNNSLKDLDAYRQELISKNNGHIVPELLTGTTREELDQSLVLAKQVFARVTQGMKKDDKGGNAGGNAGDAAPAPRTLNLPPTPNVNDNGAPGAPRQVDVKQLSPAEYAKNRAELLKAATLEARKALSEG